MKRDHIPATPAPRGIPRGLFVGALLLPAVFCLMFAVCGSPVEVNFDELQKNYIVTFNKSGANGNAPNTIVVQRGGNVTLPGQGEMTKDGYTFDGWTIPSSSKTYYAGVQYDVSGDVILYAKWTSTSSGGGNGGNGNGGGGTTYYTVTFNANGGTVYTTSAKTNSNGYLSIDLPTPTRSGYTFNGWYTSTSGGSRVTASTKFYANTTIYAQWTYNTPSVTYTITFNPNGGNVTPTSGTTNTSGNLTNWPTPTRTGYTFNGWYTSSSGGSKVTTDTKFYGNTTIYAQWTYNTPSTTTYTITFDANGGSVTPTSGTTNASGYLTTLPTPTRTGYKFDGWYTASTGGTSVTTATKFTMNTTIFAHWTSNTPSNTYTITFDANGGSGAPASVTTGTDGKLASLPATTPTRTGYTFNDWYTAPSGGTKITAGQTFTANTTVYAQWTLETYTITYELNGGTAGTPTNPTRYNVGTATITLSNPTRGGYSFDGWTGSDGTVNDKSVMIPIGSTGNKNYTANWTQITITFDPNGGSVTPASAAVRADGTIALASLPEPVLSGSTFNKWITATGAEVTLTTVFTESVTIFAQWRPNEVFTIIFDANGGEVDIPSAHTNYETFKLSSLPMPNRSGYTFAGWFTADTGGRLITIDERYTSSMTIYAHWTPIDNGE